jgi:hypothetical protein
MGPTDSDLVSKNGREEKGANGASGKRSWVFFQGMKRLEALRQFREGESSEGYLGVLEMH